MRCGKCGAMIGSHAGVCAACGKGTLGKGVCFGTLVTKDGKRVGKFYVAAGSEQSGPRYVEAKDGYGLERAEE